MLELADAVRLVARDRLNYYNYVPLLTPAIIFIILFFLISVTITFLSIRHRIAYFTVLLVGTYAEVIGYGARIKGHWAPGDFPVFLIMDVCIILAPIAFAAANYVVFGRLLRLVSANVPLRRFSFLPINRITTIFVTSDIISFLVQAAGAGLLLSRDSNGNPNLKMQKTGDDILIGGLCINLISFCFFSTVIIFFNFNLRHVSSEKTKVMLPHARKYGFYPLLIAIYCSVFLIIVRSIYRIIEFQGGFNTPVSNNEVLFYIFDASAMTLATGLYCFIFPPRFGLLGKKKMEQRITETTAPSKIEEPGEPVSSEPTETDIEVNHIDV